MGDEVEVGTGVGDGPANGEEGDNAPEMGEVDGEKSGETTLLGEIDALADATVVTVGAGDKDGVGKDTGVEREMSWLPCGVEAGAKTGVETGVGVGLAIGAV